MKLPVLRNDLEISEFYENKLKFVALSDQFGIASQPVALPFNIYSFLSEHGGNINLEDAESLFYHKIGKNFPEGFLNDLLIFLQQNGFIENTETRLYKENIRSYLTGNTRPAYCAGASYPDDFSELKKYLNSILSSSDEDHSKKFTKIMAPHIDFKIGINAHKIYANTFNNLDLNFDLAIMLGTAHYKSSDDFMFTKKHFETPLGLVETDNEILDLINSKVDNGVTFDDLAHRQEHSLELHLILLKYIMGNRNFKILPILTGSYHQYFDSRTDPNQNSRFQNIIEKINESLEATGKKAIFLASGDLSHIGRKFDQDFDALHELDKVQQDDENLINHLINFESKEFYDKLAKFNNHRNVCGLSPFYSLMNLCDSEKGEFAGYHKWYEYETQSAVTFCGINFK